MYLDNMMGKKTQKIFYSVMIVISLTLIAAGIMLWHTDALSDRDAWPMLLHGKWYAKVGIIAKIIIFSAGLGLLGSIYSIVALSTNNLSLKRNANFFQVVAISFVAIAVGAAIFDAVDQFHTRHTLYDMWGPKDHFELQIRVREPQIPVKGDLGAGTDFYHQKIDNGWNAISLRMISTWVEIAGAGLSVVPLFLYFGKSGHYLG